MPPIAASTSVDGSGAAALSLVMAMSEPARPVPSICRAMASIFVKSAVPLETAVGQRNNAGGRDQQRKRRRGVNVLVAILSVDGHAHVDALAGDIGDRQQKLIVPPLVRSLSRA